MLETKGNLSMTDLQREVVISSRQLERLYLEHIGVSPKSLAAMVRYQYLWNGLLSHNYFNIADISTDIRTRHIYAMISGNIIP